MKTITLRSGRMKWFLLALCSFLTALSVHAAPVVLEALEADDTTNTYTVIEDVLGSGTAGEVPDPIHPEFGPHITRTWDDALGKYVFNFFLHVTPDNDRTDGDLVPATDRQRNEIKTMSGSPAYLVASVGETASYRWWFKLDSGFQPSANFTHIHQIKAVNGFNDSTPLITLTPRAGSPDQLQIMFAPSDAAGQSEIASANLSGFKGEWIEANEKILNSSNGTYQIVLKRVSDGVVLLSYTNNNIIMWRGGNSSAINRPKWGIYRSLLDVGALRDEMVQFADFSLAKGSDTFSNIAPSITTAPTNLTVIENQDATFSAEASGTAALKYQWRFNTTNNLSWATNATMTVANVRSTNAGSYSVVVSNGYGTVTSAVATLTVNAATAPGITEQPQNVDAVSGMSLNFSVTVSGSAPFAYQWRKDGSPISGGTNNPLSFANVDPVNAGNYDVIVANIAGSVTSAVAVLTVVAESNIVFSVAGVTNWVCPADVTSVRVECWGGGGAGGSAKRIATTTQYGGGGAGGAYAKYISYSVTPGSNYYINVGTGGANSSTNNDTTVAGGDSWFNSANFPSTNIIAKGGAGGESAIGSTTTTGYGLRGIGTTNGSAGTVVYAGGSGFTAVSSKSGGGGSSAGTGTNGTAAISQTGATAPTGGGNGGTGRTTSSGVGGNGYAPGGAGAGARSSTTTLYAGGTGAVGKVVLTFAVAAPPIITNQPVSQAIKVGETAAFTVGISGAVPLSYRWWFNDTDLGGTATNSTLVIANAQLSHAGNYKVVITNMYGAATSTVASLTVEAVATTVSLLDVNFEGQTAGSQPTGANYIRPTANSTTQAVQVVNSTLLGGTQAVQYLDRAVNINTSSSLQYNFASNGAVVCSFSFSPSYISGTSANYLSVGLGQQVTLSSAANLYSEARLRADGSIAFYSAGTLVYSATGLAAGSSNSASMVVNDTASDIIYAGGARTNVANTVDYYFNGSLVYAGASFGATVGALGTTNGPGRVAIFDATSRTDLDYLIDNIAVSGLLPPAKVSATASVPTGSGTGTGGLTVAEGSSITLTETPSAGTAPFTYAWKKVGSGTVLGTSSNLLISSPTNGAQYTCDVAATWDGVTNTSPAVTVTVVPLVSATAAAPTGNGSGTGGMTAYSQRTRMTLTETPSGGTAPFSYAWKKVGSGAVLGTNSTLTISPLVNGDQYVCDVASTADGVTNTSPTATLTVNSVIDSNKVVIIKADDFRASNWSWVNWTNFLVASRDLGVKVSPGAVVTNMSANASIAQWMQAQEAVGDVEFWNHGWDHSQWVDNSVTNYEFSGSGLVFQQTHLTDSQEYLRSALGHDVIAFGTPYNQFDTNTTALINNTSALRLFFTTSINNARTRGLDTRVAAMKIISETGGTGMPDAAIFEATYPNGPTEAVALQFHPADSNFNALRVAEYQEIVQFLLTKGYVFLTPTEYVAFLFPVTNVAPSVSLTAPTDNADFTAPASITITASASDTDGTITNVGFYNGATLLGSDASSPYAYTWTNVAPGSYSLTARAADNDGAISTSAVVTVTVASPVYTLTVNSGTGGGSYTNGRQVAISAYAPAAGKAFDKWIGDTQYVNNVTYTNATVTMSTNAVNLTATYVDVYYALTVNSGTGGGGAYTNGTQVAIAANAPAAGKAFDKWIGDTQYVANASSLNTTVTMPAQAITLTATYADVYYSLTINYGTGGGLSYIYEQQVAILANAPAAGKAFDKWIGDTQYLANASSASTSLTMPAQNVVLTATYVDVYYTLTANGATGGTVSPPFTNTPAGSSVTFVITASNYYRIVTLTTNGATVTGMSFDNNSTTTNFTWSNVQTDGVLAVTFTVQVVTNPAASGAAVPYRWMAQYGLTNSGATFDQAAAADQDSDGLAAWQEYITGTDPTNGTSCLKAAQTTLNKVSWSAVSGRVYSVYWSTNLMNGFTALNTNISYPQSSYTNTTPDSKVNHYQIKVRLQ